MLLLCLGIDSAHVILCVKSNLGLGGIKGAIASKKTCASWIINKNKLIVSKER